MTGRFAGRTVSVTGASSGIGRSIALALADEGAAVTVLDRDQDPVEGGTPTTELIAAAGGVAAFARVDLADTAAIDAAVEETVDRSGRLDAIVNNAATYSGTALLETSDEDWDRVLTVNVRGVFALCRAAVRQMVGQDPDDDGVRGRIVNVGSQHGIHACPGDIAYGTSKSAVMYLTKQIAVDYASAGIVCNTVAPGKIYTGKGGWELDDERRETAASRTPLPREGRPGDVARSVLFLASGEASFVTGATLMVDGGWHAA